jgi:uncharacterized protein YdeI (YjbR/CyaY-like superfamily)
MELKDGVKTFYAKDAKSWRKWLEKNHAKEKNVWLIMYRKESNTPSVYYSEAVDQALCFGWIDSKPNKRDDESFYQFFAKRNPKSAWSKVNKNKVEKLIAQGLMTEEGMKMIAEAKLNGSWVALDKIEALSIPDDLNAALKKNKTAATYFNAFPPSSKKIILTWIESARKPETRQSRITETVKLAEQNIRANHYRQ